jgi:hypothetical protein
MLRMEAEIEENEPRSRPLCGQLNENKAQKEGENKKNMYFFTFSPYSPSWLKILLRCFSPYRVI